MLAEQRTRSAEQTARLLLSKAFRYDTWECNAARREIQNVGGVPTTVRLAFSFLKHKADYNLSVLSLSLFDPSSKLFVGATHRVELQQMDQPLVFQCSFSHMLVVELLARETRPHKHSSQEEYRVVVWGTCPVKELSQQALLSLRPGSAHLLLLDQHQWPEDAQPTSPAPCTLTYECQVDQDTALAHLLRELVPPGIFVNESFTKSTAPDNGSLFRLVLHSIELVGTTDESQRGLLNDADDWSVAAVAHNGYRQLGKGSEVPLALERRKKVEGQAEENAPHHGDLGSSASSSMRSGTGNLDSLVLRSSIPLEIDDLPVHSATSLVLAIRRRDVSERTHRVMGFCVFPLCIMPMKDRDVRVENLPALRGPFSCEDARLLMVDAATPYGRLPIALTLTVEYHDTAVPAGAKEEEKREEPAPRAATETTASIPITPEAMPDRDGVVAPKDAAPIEAPPPPVVPATMEPPPAIAPPVGPPAATTGGISFDQSSGDIFKLLSSIMEELNRVRVAQDELLRQGSAKDRGDHALSLSPETLERLSHKLAGGPVDVVDLLPRPLSISWKAKRAIQDGQQPILHPLRGTRLEESSPAVGALPAALFGMRLEGLSMDKHVSVPHDLCFLFSFGPMPPQRVGPVMAMSVEQTSTYESFRFLDGERGGFVWCEPIESLANASMARFKEGGGNATIYLHIFDALTMFYVATARVPLASFRRPFNAECGMWAMELPLDRDMSLTEEVLPVGVLPLIRNVGQLHLTVFAVGIGQDYGVPIVKSSIVREPVLEPSRVVVAKRIKHADQLLDAPQPLTSALKTQHSVADEVAGASASASGSASMPATNTLHWQRAEHIKMMLRANEQRAGSGSPALPGVPPAHMRATFNAEMEAKLRYVEKERDEKKSQSIARMLMDRLTVHHDVVVAAWRPEEVRTTFRNPYTVPMQFSIHVEEPLAEVCQAIPSPSFYLGPKERTEVVLSLRFGSDHAGEGERKHEVSVQVYTERRELIQRICIHVLVGPPLVDRRVEIFGPPGSTITKRCLSRVFSSSAFPLSLNRGELLKRMGELCSFATTSTDTTTAETNAAIDPITQSFITAWEEVAITTQIPAEMNASRVEYLTLFHDVGLTRVYETWELCIFGCSCLITRDMAWGQTTAMAIPAGGAESMYASDASATVASKGSSFVLRVRPRDVGSHRMLLHVLEGDSLRKVLLTIPVVEPNPTYTQVIELAVSDASAPIFRRLTFVNDGDREEVFRVHHNYNLQLLVSPSSFTLAPGDSISLSLQLDHLSLPPGQTEGRWPMWLFINNADDKTISSYLLQVVLRLHPLVSVVGE